MHLLYAGQVVLGSPVSVICLGEASSGKSHIQETALRLIPNHYIVNERKSLKLHCSIVPKKMSIFMTARLSTMVTWAESMTMTLWKSQKIS